MSGTMDKPLRRRLHPEARKLEIVEAAQAHKNDAWDVASAWHRGRTDAADRD